MGVGVGAGVEGQFAEPATCQGGMRSASPRQCLDVLKEAQGIVTSGETFLPSQGGSDSPATGQVPGTRRDA